MAARRVIRFIVVVARSILVVGLSILVVGLSIVVVGLSIVILGLEPRIARIPHRGPFRPSGRVHGCSGRARA